ncbi:hypothetical protein M436DRAFT_60267 [Aureobasidium namibiae CBS 147.97]|uniref:Uncharacterized protein n=1 Tax=Aureobasidium namibiae CBS 147.97 TaxID=1043004 RepID=A0A074WTF4_9PEZI
MAVPTTAKCPNRVSWAFPLVKSRFVYPPVHRSSSTVDEGETHGIPQDHRTAIDSLRNILQKQPLTTHSLQLGRSHDSPGVSNEVVTSKLPEEQKAHKRQERIHSRCRAREEAERIRYDQHRQNREELLLFRDASYGDYSRDFRWTAACKLVDTLASRDTEARPDYFFSDSNLLVALFINCDLDLQSKEILAEYLLRDLVIDFPHVKSFRFAVYFPRQMVEEESAVPEALRYLLGTLSHLQRTATLEGATTEMEQKFVTRQLHYMRRARFDPVEVQKDSLDVRHLVAKVDPDDTYDIVMGSRSSEETLQSMGAKPIDIVCRKRTDVDAAWIKPTTAFHWA